MSASNPGRILSHSARNVILSQLGRNIGVLGGMDKTALQSLLDREIEEWSSKSFSKLIEELADVVTFQRGGKPDFHQFEVQMIEQEPEYLHILVSVDDGSFRKFFAPLTRGFIVHRDGRVEK